MGGEGGSEAKGGRAEQPEGKGSGARPAPSPAPHRRCSYPFGGRFSQSSFLGSTRPPASSSRKKPSCKWPRERERKAESERSCLNPPPPTFKNIPRYADDCRFRQDEVERESRRRREPGVSGRSVCEGFPEEGAIGVGPDQVPLERWVEKELLAECSACRDSAVGSSAWTPRIWGWLSAGDEERCWAAGPKVPG